ncbi:MAG: aminodeoxychorismate synthase component I [Lamprobacter sp.]|uniref:aminodeoxychorismate synthase component I n=1 Tax=Lamprobacter sp. TaxID=3100796 RepID=UPI002B2599DF|nr:aminodeoxychorismate synthase component I [Lamprobacter sp.]MEA3639340.1 aminodeoxychorismate synthase component I [Lamprobacter sp.]
MRYLNELPYRADSANLFTPLSSRPWAMFLDSATACGGGGGRWDILVTDPSATLVTRGVITEVRDAAGCYRSGADPFSLLREALGPPAAHADPAIASLPFVGGAIGWFGYDLARRLEHLPVHAIDAEGLPEMAIGIFDWALLVDHGEQRSWLVSAGRDARTQARWPRLLRQFRGMLSSTPTDLPTDSPTDAPADTPTKRSIAFAAEQRLGQTSSFASADQAEPRSAATSSPASADLIARGPIAQKACPPLHRLAPLRTPEPLLAPQPLHTLEPLRSNLARAEYAAAFARIKGYIRAGDCYQINLAQRFAARASGDPWSAYRRLRQLNPAPFSAYLQTPFGQILSSSPERFLALRDGRVETRPIKGTRPRSADPDEDAALKRALAESPKDRAENLMIVDLLRNDLGRVCRTGSIQVPSLFATESYASVHHLVSTITGELRANEDASSLLRACFPGGSITGAPKIRAMQIIEALEPHRRGVYCGAIGYLGFDGAMDTNIAIRTIVHSAGQVRFWSGGGLVHDSDCEQEYRETFDKAARLIELLAPGPAGRELAALIGVD